MKWSNVKKINTDVKENPEKQGNIQMKEYMCSTSGRKSSKLPKREANAGGSMAKEAVVPSRYAALGHLSPDQYNQSCVPSVGGGG